MQYDVFTDESGSWHDGKELYVRSWIKLNASEYVNLTKEVLYLKHTEKIKEIKWENMAAEPKRFSRILSCDFQAFITISSPECINYKTYKVIQNLENMPDGAFTGDEEIRTTCKSKILSAARSVLFLNFYEKMHVENATQVLVTSLEDSYNLHVHSPQFLDREWLKMSLQYIQSKDEDKSKDELKFETCEMHKVASEVPGIEVADCVAGCIRSCLLGDDNAKKIFQTHVKDKMCDMTSKVYPNPNLIFFNELKTTYVPLLKRLR